MKVLFLMQLPPPVHGASVINRFIKESNIINKSFDCSYLDISPAKEITDLGKFSLKKIIYSVQIFFAVTRTFQSFKPDLIYVTLSPHGIAFFKDSIFVLLAKLFSINVVVHLHGKGIDATICHRPILKALYKFVFKNVNVFHLSESLFGDIELVRDKNRKLIAINNGVGEIEHKARPESLNGKLRVIYLSNLVPTKGADTLLDSLSYLGESHQKDLHVDIIGKESNKRFVEKLKNKLVTIPNVDVVFHGPKYGNEKEDFLYGSDLFVLPTRFKNECFPLSILEAMSVALPILSTREGAIPDIVEHGKHGYLFDKESPEELAKYLSNYIENKDDLKSHGEAAYQKYKSRYTLDCFENKMVSALKEVVADV